MDGIPLFSLGVLINLVITTGRSVPGGVKELGAGAVGVADLKVPLLPLASIHCGDLLLKTRHKVLERCPVICQGLLSCFKLRRLRGGLHGVPGHAVGCLDHFVGSFRLLVEGAVVPQGAAVFPGGFQDALFHRAKAQFLLHTGEGLPHLRFLQSAAGELRHVVEGGAALPGGHLIPAASIRCGHHSIRPFRGFILVCTVIIHL